MIFGWICESFSFWLYSSPLYSPDIVKCKSIISKAIVNMFTTVYIISLLQYNTYGDFFLPVFTPVYPCLLPYIYYIGV